MGAPPESPSKPIIRREREKESSAVALVDCFRCAQERSESAAEPWRSAYMERCGAAAAVVTGVPRTVENSEWVFVAESSETSVFGERRSRAFFFEKI